MVARVPDPVLAFAATYGTFALADGMAAGSGGLGCDPVGGGGVDGC